jgi:hypothetical protein
MNKNKIDGKIDRSSSKQHVGYGTELRLLAKIIEQNYMKNWNKTFNKN